MARKSRSQAQIEPFANEAQVLSVGELTAENRADRVSIFGTVDLTRDRAGLEKARALKTLLDAVVARSKRRRSCRIPSPHPSRPTGRRTHSDRTKEGWGAGSLRRLLPGPSKRRIRSDGQHPGSSIARWTSRDAMRWRF